MDEDDFTVRLDPNRCSFGVGVLTLARSAYLRDGIDLSPIGSGEMTPLVLDF